MGRYRFILKRLLLTIPLLFGIVFLVFMILHVTPGDPARQIVGLRASEQQLQEVRTTLGLNDPVVAQYARYVGHVVTGDFGYSYKSNESVTSLIAERLPVTIWLLTFGIAFTLLISVPLGIITALRADKATDHVVRAGGLLGLAMPSFWVGILLILLIALPTGLFPVGGFGQTVPEHINSIILPAVTLAIATAPLVIRSLRTAAPPTISVVALEVGFLLFGAVVIETTFALPGVGQGIVLAARQRDLPAIQGYTLLFALIVVAVYLVADIISVMIDPRLEVAS
jgi:peptide/nickel transport system permease protein